MLYNERIELIMQQVQLQSVVKISDLTELMKVSVDTVRRDLRTLEQKGMIKCIRGGACLPDHMMSFSGFAGREIVHSDLKREAARKAMKYVKSESVVALNAGTTTTILAQELLLRNDRYTVVTNNLAAVQILMQSSSIQLIAVGGMVDMSEKSTYGTECEKEFARFHPDVAFLSLNAVNDTDGFTDFRYHEIGIIQLLAERACQVIPVMDSSKLGRRSRKDVLTLDQADCLVMDDHVTEEQKKNYMEKGIVIE